MKRFLMQNKLKLNIMITDTIVAKQSKIRGRAKLKGMPLLVGLFQISKRLF